MRQRLAGKMPWPQRLSSAESSFWLILRSRRAALIFRPMGGTAIFIFDLLFVLERLTALRASCRSAFVTIFISEFEKRLNLGGVTVSVIIRLPGEALCGT